MDESKLGHSQNLLYVYFNSPLDQFNINSIISVEFFNEIKLSFTNIGLYLTVVAYILVNYLVINSSSRRLVCNRGGSSQESIYATAYSIVVNQITSQKGLMFFPLIFTIFALVLANNLVGMVPYNFASTSHFVITFFLSFTIVIGATFLGLIIHTFKFFSLLVPAGCPFALLPLLVLIEFISYVARNVSLGLRLAANILSGHMLLNILSGFTFNIMKSGFIYPFVSMLPLAFIIAFSGLEVAIAFIQAQVFVVLTCSYVNDALNLH